jgi:hypothetical protein
MTNEQFDKYLDVALKRHADATQDTEAAAARVMMRLGGALPRQKRPLWRLPAVLLDWQFLPAWPRLAALGACAALGFAIGLSGADRHIGHYDRTSATGYGLSSAMSEPEELTGAQP